MGIHEKIAMFYAGLSGVLFVLAILSNNLILAIAGLGAATIAVAVGQFGP